MNGLTAAEDLSRLQNELDLAANIQRSLLPHKSPFIKGIRTSWLFEPSEQLGGDSLNIFALDEHHVGFYVMDVAGHGIPAALVSVAASYFLSPFSDYSFLRGLNARHIEGSPILCPHEVLKRLNDQFSSHPVFRSYLTLFYGILNTRTLELSYASAGHTPLAHQRDGRTVFLRDGDLPVGIASDMEFNVHAVSLQAGDRLFVYSDGITEARTMRGDLFGEERLRMILDSSKRDSLEKVLAKTFSAIRSCVPTGKLADDVTLLGIEIA